MAYSEALAQRIRGCLARRKNFQERKMFGGLGFLLNGNMCVGVWKNSLVVRTGPDGYSPSLKQPFVREFDITGRPMTGWVLVAPEGLEHDDELHLWIEQAIAFVRTLPAKRAQP